MALTHINPESLDQNPMFSQGVLVKDGSHLVVGGQNAVVASAGATFASAQEVWGNHLTAVSVIQVSGLAGPNFLVEVSALALVS